MNSKCVMMRKQEGVCGDDGNEGGYFHEGSDGDGDDETWWCRDNPLLSVHFSSSPSSFNHSRLREGAKEGGGKRKERGGKRGR